VKEGETYMTLSIRASYSGCYFHFGNFQATGTVQTSGLRNVENNLNMADSIFDEVVLIQLFTNSESKLSGPAYLLKKLASFFQFLIHACAL